MLKRAGDCSGSCSCAVAELKQIRQNVLEEIELFFERESLLSTVSYRVTAITNANNSHLLNLLESTT